MDTIKRGAYFGLISFILIIILIGILGYQTITYYTNQTEINYSNFTIILLNLVLLISSLGILFYYLAFLKLGKINKNKLLTIMSWIFVIFAYINLFLTFISIIITFIDLAKAQEMNSSFYDIYIIIALLIILIAFIIIFSVLNILFGIGIKRLKNVKYSRITGLLYIISGATMILGIGFILIWIANFYSIALLWKVETPARSAASKKKK